MLDSDMATDGTHAYYRGLRMSEANPATMRRMRSLNDGQVRESYKYFADGRRIYFESQLLPVRDGADVYAFEVGPASDEAYLFIPAKGMVYIGAQAFARNGAPYKLINERGAHTHHEMFSSADGIYVFDKQQRKLKRVGKNPFASGNFIALSPYVFSNGKRTLFFGATESWGSSSRGGHGGLISRSTLVRELGSSGRGPWEKLGDVYHDFGSVWRNGSDLYYFDNLGSSQLVRSSVYRIADSATADALIQTMETMTVSADDIRKLIRDGKLMVPPSSNILEATSCYRSWFRFPGRQPGFFAFRFPLWSTACPRWSKFVRVL